MNWYVIMYVSIAVYTFSCVCTHTKTLLHDDQNTEQGIMYRNGNDLCAKKSLASSWIPGKVKAGSHLFACIALCPEVHMK